MLSKTVIFYYRKTRSSKLIQKYCSKLNIVTDITPSVLILLLSFVLFRWFDLRGNHDAFNLESDDDKNNFYMRYSVQGALGM